MQKLIDFMNSKKGSIIASIILGLGLATLFRQTCGQNCIVVKAPDLDELRKNMYEIDGTCYKYTPKAASCDSGSAPAKKGSQGGAEEMPE